MVAIKYKSGLKKNNKTLMRKVGCYASKEDVASAKLRKKSKGKTSAVDEKVRAQCDFMMKTKLSVNAKCPECDNDLKPRSFNKNFIIGPFDECIKCPKCEHKYAVDIVATYNDGTLNYEDKACLMSKDGTKQYFRKTHPSATKRDLANILQKDPTLCYNCVFHQWKNVDSARMYLF